MAVNESRIPAWKRLGLVLKNEASSGVTAPNPSIALRDSQPVASLDGPSGHPGNVQSSIEPALNGNSSRLGKRKQQHEPAEDHLQTSKKGKVDLDSAIEPTVETFSPEQSNAEAPRPKGGDPNYRKKKEKPAKKRREYGESQSQTAPVKAVKSQSRQLLSPGDQLQRKKSPTLLASTEIHHESVAPVVTPRKNRETSTTSTQNTSLSPSRTERRKSVAFTPDTKKVDGHSAQNLFKKWVSEQRGTDASYSVEAVAEAPEPEIIAHEPEITEEVTETKKVEKRSKKDKKSNASTTEQEQSDPSEAPADPSTTSKEAENNSESAATVQAPTKGKKKDPSVYLAYLTQYHTDRNNWKFNKAKQNDVVDNALNIFRIPDEHSEALLEYVQGLKGAGVVQRLKEKCNATLKDLDKEDAAAEASMSSSERQAMQDEALQERIEMESKRRKVEGDVAGFADHPHPEAFIRRLRRKRALALIETLARTAPILPAPQANGINPTLKHVAGPPVRDSKKRKRRLDVSSDESSSDSSSSSDSDSDSDDSDSDSDSSSDAESDSSSDAESSDSDSDESSGSDSD